MTTIPSDGIRVTTQEELDAALKEKSGQRIYIDSRAGSWLYVYGFATVYAYGDSWVVAHDSTTVHVFDSATVTAHSDSVTIHAYNL